jgi:hypothetical protein
MNHCLIIIRRKHEESSLAQNRKLGILLIFAQKLASFPRLTRRPKQNERHGIWLDFLKIVGQ